ncbi:hypothetical protein O8C76_02580 [Aliarcobacter butzleri]|uniref:DUF304 domain-containing protein n=1 Tax=Aliarcobacter butzleri TaxID=28197 RepID=A0AAW7PWN2_9BACT|nr:hypothetical protein [Aliarcobacter butzleri]MDN5069914.1 hypothetical protein [Aliarcobacter butzleri]
MYEQNFDFRNSNNEFSENSKIIDNKGAHIQNQNNIFNSYTIFRPFKLENSAETKIEIRKQFLDNQNIRFYAFFSLVFVMTIFYIFDFEILGFNLDLESFIILLGYVSLLIFNFFTFSIIFNKGELEIEENKILIKFRKNQKEIEYSQIRSILKQTTMVGHIIYIFKEDNIQPYLQFNVDSIHTALTIEQLIISKITNIRN